jgi:hypothetical protein
MLVFVFFLCCGAFFVFKNIVMTNEIELLIVELDFLRLKLTAEKKEYGHIGYDGTEKAFSVGKIEGKIEIIS